MTDSGEIQHVSDTARWVAIYRAMETERPDAIFRDPFARRLGGARGEAIVNALPRGRQMAWAMIVRTALFDEIILERVKGGGVDLVVNLAAGLDARPWRLDLPAALRWVDVDLPGILGYKTDLLRDETPRCRYEAVHADLTDAAVRHALFTQLAGAAERALVVSEGLLIYLDAAQVADLAGSLHAAPSFRWWLADFPNTRLLRMIQRRWGGQLSAGNAPMQFAVDDAESWFAPLGWRVAQLRSGLVEAHRLRREMRFGWIARFLTAISLPKKREQIRRMSQFALLERA